MAPPRLSDTRPLFPGFSMSSRKRRKPKPQKTDHSQRMNRLKAKALAQVANRAWAYNLRYKTISLLTEAVRREPDNPELLLNLAAACGRQRYYDRAEELLARVLELAPRKATIHRRVAQVYALIDRPEQAVACFRRSLELNRDTTATVPTLLDLARHYERRHQLDDARAVVAEALEREPAHPDAQLQQAMLDRRGGFFAEAESRLRALAAHAAHPWQLRAQASYELGQLLDQQERYDEAFDALTSAKRLMVPHATEAVRLNQESLRRNAEIVATIDKTHYERWQIPDGEDTVYRIATLTSHPRSGTTLVEQVLDSHDQLVSADEFDVYSQWIHLPILRKFRYGTPVLTALDHVPPAVRRQARATYWKQTEAIFDEPIGDRMLLDKNPGLMVMLPAVNWAFPEMKMLIAIRDPRDVILSCFMQRVPLTPISSNWLALDPAAEFYTCAMRTWLKVRELTSGRWIEFRYEDVVADLESHARRILEFLGLPWDERVLRFYEHAREKLVRSPTYQDVTQPVYQKSVARWRHYEKHLAPILDKLAPFVREFGYEA